MGMLTASDKRSERVHAPYVKASWKERNSMRIGPVRIDDGPGHGIWLDPGEIKVFQICIDILI